MHYLVAVLVPTNVINIEQYITKQMKRYAHKWQRHNVNSSLEDDTIPDVVLTPDGNWHERLMGGKAPGIQRTRWVNQVEVMRVQHSACDEVIVDCYS